MALDAYFTLSVSDESSFADGQPVTGAAGHADLISDLVTQRPIKYARFHCPATLLILRVLSGMKLDHEVSPDDLGVLTTAGPYHLRNAWQSTQRIESKGCRFVTPAEFPHTIMSSVPTSIAMALNARAFAFAAGDSELAFFQNVRRALLMLDQGYAGAVMLCTCYLVDPILHARLSSMGRERVSGAFAAVMLLTKKQTSATEYGVRCLDPAGDVTSTAPGVSGPGSLPSSKHIGAAVSDEGDLSFDGEAAPGLPGRLSASGALFLSQALSRHCEKPFERVRLSMYQAEQRSPELEVRRVESG